MTGTHTTLSRLSRGIAVAASLVALAAPAALADPPGLSQDSTRFVTDTLAPGGGLVTSAPTATGFDWSDAGIGAASSVGLLLILLGGAQLVSRRRSVIAV